MVALSNSGQADTQILITPAMIDAGVSVLCDYEPNTGVSLADLAERLFVAMVNPAKVPLVNDLHE